MKTEKHSGSIILYFFLAALLILSAFLLKQIFDRYINKESKRIMSSGFEIRQIIIDAGHGGTDGGAISVTGMPEKELNLQTSQTLEAMMTALGFQVIMTRNSDTELTCPESGGSRKMQDLKGRLKIAEANPEIPFVSIHMNKFPQSKYSGLQVYYSPNNTESKVLADAIQESVKSMLQPENNRETKPATSSIYLLYKIKSPAVLIECGFISNQQEAELLENKEYRQSLCLAISSALACEQAADK